MEVPKLKGEFKSPAFQWYPKDVLGSVRVAEMPIDIEGYYRRALDFAWLNDGLPNDPVRIAAIVGKGCSREAAEWVLRMFEPDARDPVKVRNQRQEVERKKQRENSKKRKEAGRLSGVKRREQRDLTLEQMLEQNANKNEPSYSYRYSYPNNSEPKGSGVPPVAASAAVEIDPVESRIWKEGVDLLQRSDMKPESARSLLGKLAKDHGKELLAECIAAAQAHNPADPKAWITAALKRRSNPNPEAFVGKAYDEPEATEYIACETCEGRSHIFPPNGRVTDAIPCPDCTERITT
jgi:hypothetical protein